MKKFYFLTLALILGAMTMSAKTIEIRGGFNNWTADADVLTETSTGVWEITKDASYFNNNEAKIVIDGKWCGGNNITAGETKALSYGGGNNFKITGLDAYGKATIKVTDKGYNNYDISVIGSGLATYPETLYVIGNLKVSSGAWDPSKAKELEKKAEGVFGGTFTILNSGDGNGYFGFIVNKGANSSDWSVNSNRFGASAGDNTEVKKGDESTLARGENSWKIEVTDQDGMDVSVIVDLKSSKLTIIDSVATAIEEVGVDAGEAVYYNLQGVKVANPENGIFIKKQGNKTTKVVL